MGRRIACATSCEATFMRKTVWALLILAAAVAAGIVLYSQNRAGAAEISMPAGPSFRILLGVKDQQPTSWDGSVTVSPGAIASIHGWRFAAGDSTDSKSSWKASTRTAVGRQGNVGGMMENGVI